jgi:hypothetical protein
MTLDLRGKIIGKLTVIRETDKRSQRSIIWECKCQCGNTAFIAARDLTNSAKPRKGCGKCGVNLHPLYSTWSGMKSRCYNKTTPNYKDYGGRGITVCDRWKNSFLDFLSDMGEKPSSDHSLDRINNDGNYEPTNCRWATWSEQSTNQRVRSNPTGIDYVAIYMSTQPLQQLAATYKLTVQTISNIKCLGYSTRATFLVGKFFNLADPLDKKAIKAARLKYRFSNAIYPTL